MAIYCLYDGRIIMLSQMQQMLMSMKWCQRFVERRDAVNIFQPKDGSGLVVVYCSKGVDQ